ncbi:MAG: four helix bundle protein [Patescibacteria group bacterium]
MSIALKECHETQYWYDLLYDSNYLDNYADYNVINEKLKELLGVITKIVKTTKNNLP